MKYNVEEPNGNVHEITVPKNAVGQVCFEKLCEKLGIVEQHYFGLTRSVNHDTKAWLNLRNPLMTQLRPHITGKPHRLRLDVKFYVLPQEIQHERTRHFFYHALKRNLGEGKFVLSQNQLTKLYALIRQTESGDFVHSPSSVGEQAARTTTPLNALETDIQQEHQKLKAMPENVAKLKFISILAETEFYFWDLFKVKLGGEKLIAAVGTMGLRLIYRRSPQCTREIVSYYDISKISLFEERMILVVKRANDTYRFLHFFHTSCESAKVMHKCVLEKKLFYFEPKILDSVRNHYMLSFPCWAYPSKWLTRKTVPELYHLDVRCTRRQAYEEHFEALHKTKDSKVVDDCGESSEDDCDGFDEAVCPIPVCKKCNDSENIVAYSPCGHVEHCMRCAKGVQLCGVCDAPIANMLKTYIATDGFSDELVCQICMDKELSTVFSPCGHIYCCDECAAKLTFCPLCKKWILFNQRIQFLCLDVPKGCCT